ncbi:DoxX family protein [Dyadobacter sp. CY261]|uniref:DoxX family protein n=1 Tax=Dyadobacter sp. CY261 TaxID=2907203 RepID=UPI001F17F9CF|nr:DoxX family protein [Dyadobacter sp. CY261]MCF0074066.1 DoxX family protein [Dyadobacter sp. CY261]
MAIKKNSKTMHITLWIVQSLLSVTLVWAAYMKLFESPEALAAMWQWTGQVSPMFVKLTGIIDLLAGIGLILPAWLRIRPALTFVTAACVVLLMLCAMLFHLSRGESPVFNLFFGLLAAFVAWGRQERAASPC